MTNKLSTRTDPRAFTKMTILPLNHAKIIKLKDDQAQRDFRATKQSVRIDKVKSRRKKRREKNLSAALNHRRW